MKAKDVEVFEKLDSQMQTLFEEVGELAKKKPDGAINKFKLGIINSLLQDAGKILGDTYKPIKGFDGFNDEDLPTNSDVVMVCGQYLSCLEKLRADNVDTSGGRWFWKIEGKTSSFQTGAPKKIRARE